MQQRIQGFIDAYAACGVNIKLHEEKNEWNEVVCFTITLGGRMSVSPDDEIPITRSDYFFPQKGVSVIKFNSYGELLSQSFIG